MARSAAVRGGRVHSVAEPSSPSARRCFPRSCGCCGWVSLGGTSALIRSPRNWSYRGVVLTGDTVGAGRRGRHPHRVYRWGRLCSAGGHRVEALWMGVSGRHSIPTRVNQQTTPVCSGSTLADELTPLSQHRHEWAISAGLADIAQRSTGCPRRTLRRRARTAAPGAAPLGRHCPRGHAR